jgi:hypothetical protein
MNTQSLTALAATFYARILDKTYPFNLSVSAILLNECGGLIWTDTMM